MHVQIHEEAQRKAEAEAAAVLEERHRASEEAARMAAAAKQRAHSMHQIQAQQESEAKKKYELLSKHLSSHCLSTVTRHWKWIWTLKRAITCTFTSLFFHAVRRVHLLCSPPLRRMMCISFMLSRITMSASEVQHVVLLQIAPLQKLQSLAADHLLP